MPPCPLTLRDTLRTHIRTREAGTAGLSHWERQVHRAPPRPLEKEPPGQKAPGPQRAQLPGHPEVLTGGTTAPSHAEPVTPSSTCRLPRSVTGVGRPQEDFTQGHPGSSCASAGVVASVFVKLKNKKKTHKHTVSTIRMSRPGLGVCLSN